MMSDQLEEQIMRIQEIQVKDELWLEKEQERLDRFERQTEQRFSKRNSRLELARQQAVVRIDKAETLIAGHDPDILAPKRERLKAFDRLRRVSQALLPSIEEYVNAIEDARIGATTFVPRPGPTVLEQVMRGFRSPPSAEEQARMLASMIVQPHEIGE